MCVGLRDRYRQPGRISRISLSEDVDGWSFRQVLLTKDDVDFAARMNGRATSSRKGKYNMRLQGRFPATCRRRFRSKPSVPANHMCRFLRAFGVPTSANAVNMPFIFNSLPCILHRGTLVTSIPCRAKLLRSSDLRYVGTPGRFVKLGIVRGHEIAQGHDVLSQEKSRCLVWNRLLLVSRLLGSNIMSTAFILSKFVPVEFTSTVPQPSSPSSCLLESHLIGDISIGV